MIDGPDRWQELDSVLDRVLDGIYDDADLRRLNAILRADTAACRRYIHYVELHGRLAWGESVGTAVELPYQPRFFPPPPSKNSPAGRGPDAPRGYSGPRNCAKDPRLPARRPV